MFLGFAQFGKQSNNSKTNSKKQARKSNEKHENIINKSIFFHQFSWLFQSWKMRWLFNALFMKKWAPKWSQNRCQNRTMTILGGPRAARDPLWMFSGRKKTEKGCSKIDAKKMDAFLEASGWKPWVDQGRFWSRRGGKEGTSPSGNRRIRIWIAKV